jgi:hypothetical protein
MPRLVDFTASGVSLPYHTFRGHTSAVKDMYIGWGRTSVRLATVSLDRTCKVSFLRYASYFPEFFLMILVDLRYGMC